MGGVLPDQRQIGEVVGPHLDGRQAKLQKHREIRWILRCGQEQNTPLIAAPPELPPLSGGKLAAFEHLAHGLGDGLSLRAIGEFEGGIPDKLLGAERLELDCIGPSRARGVDHRKGLFKISVMVDARLGHDERLTAGFNPVIIEPDGGFYWCINGRFSPRACILDLRVRKLFASLVVLVDLCLDQLFHLVAGEVLELSVLPLLLGQFHVGLNEFPVLPGKILP